MILNFLHLVATPGPEQDIHINKDGGVWQYEANPSSSELSVTDVSANQPVVSMGSGEESPNVIQPYAMKRQRRLACRCPNCVDNQGR